MRVPVQDEVGQYRINNISSCEEGRSYVVAPEDGEQVKRIRRTNGFQFKICGETEEMMVTPLDEKAQDWVGERCPGSRRRTQLQRRYGKRG